MSHSRALELRCSDAADEGIYARTQEGHTTGPLSEKDFHALCRAPAGKSFVSAYRLAAGHAYPIALKHRVRFDSKHACSCAAFSHALELLIIILCGLCTAFVCLLLNSDKHKQESKEAGPKTLVLLWGLAAFTGVLLVMTVLKLIQRWRRVSTDVFASEV